MNRRPVIIDSMDFSFEEYTYDDYYDYSVFSCLDEEEMKLVKLKYIKKMSAREIAILLDTSIGKIYYKLNNIKEKIRKQIKI